MVKAVFFGSPMVSVKVLKEVIRAGHEIPAIYTRPARRGGRSRELMPTPVAVAGKKLGIPVRTPVNLGGSEIQAELCRVDADVFLIASYGTMLPPHLLSIPPLGALNIHPSLLPRHRGPSPVVNAILEGDEETGTSIMLLDKGMDTGPLLAQSETFPIDFRTTAGELTERLFTSGATLLINTLELWTQNKIVPRSQEESKATISKLLKRSDGNINWSLPAIRIERMVRAYDPWPGTFTKWGDRNLKVLAVTTVDRGNGPPGMVSFGDEGLIISTGLGSLLAVRLQLEGRTPISGKEFARGYPGIEGSLLGLSGVQ